jgi:hypothetical protein
VPRPGALAAPPHQPPDPPPPRPVLVHPERLRRREPTLTVSVSAVLLLGLLVYLLWRYTRTPIWHILVCVLFGYFLAASSIAPNIGRVLTAAARYISGLDL